MNGWIWLGFAIAAEVLATTTLNANNDFSRPSMLALTVIGYLAAFSCLALALRTIPLGIAYAIWSGAGIAALSLIGWLNFRQPLSIQQLGGLLLVMAGILVLRLPVTR
ncbi:multidrug efflux SMR transporter [Novosphingobium sp. KCTC 2891]|uniref:DMT family transporter n=1 Tax=Novosphingobium sp. KCTC 2891 TaxID=2989730 RepID=UPI0022225830|nr:multidrug efflux SMR transporter [Novosphingobium sp. KCTC 2891]MCW1383782.1 multidrug efflux SMR transporter [Novosphingobium sp. KCTC 2891]